MSKLGSVFAADGQSIFLVPAAHERIGADPVEDRGNTATVGIELHFRPPIGLWPSRVPGVLGLDPKKLVFPVSTPCQFPFPA
jgi:hypothetical protein